MCPSGFLGRRIASGESDLQLNADPRTWSAADAMRALTLAGHDLSGNLLLGTRSLERFLAIGDESFTADFGALSDVDQHGSSSLGGERPKLVTRDWLIKYSPPLNTSAGTRWSDLLELESLAASTLSAAGIRSVQAGTSLAGQLQRRLLFIHRFDRIVPKGRFGAVTLYWLSMDRLGDVRATPQRVLQCLVDEGHIASEDLATVDRVHAFSAAIGNNDAHLGNYGLTFDDDGRVALAPFYDILPMALAPAHDELPDARLQPRTQPIREDVRELVNDLVQRAEADPEVSREFLDLWRRHIGV
jgi:hypothetical protein